MVADIFYPIFTLKITVFACFIQKNIIKKIKNIGGLAPTRASPWTNDQISRKHSDRCWERRMDKPCFIGFFQLPPGG